MNWINEVEKRKERLIRDTQDFLKIKSVLNEEESKPGAPFGEGIKNSLEFILSKCEEFGMSVKNVDGYAGHVEFGQGSELVGILCHVDVVPEGEGWTTEPYSADIRDGKIYARGAIDDKGPTMAAVYALKIIKDLELKLNKRVRIIFGTDEESGWRGVNHYFKQEEMPTIGFAPDAEFPIIITEKGILNLSLKGQIEGNQSDKATIISIKAGNRTNMVPDRAYVKITGSQDRLNQIKGHFEEFLKVYEYGGVVKVNGEILDVELNGVSAHGMEPYKGINAGLELIHFIVGEKEFIHIDQRLKWLDETLFLDHYGKKLSILYEDAESGQLTVNTGVITLADNEIEVKLNIRYPVTTEFDEMISNIEKAAIGVGINLKVLSNSKPHHVDSNHFLVQTLKKVYEEQTGQEANLLSIGGGTYARALDKGVAFGALFPGKKETAHQKDEYIEIEDLLRATAIYSQAIYELAK